MKICSICRKSDMLCSACSKKMENGEITQKEVDFYKIINKLAEDKKITIDIIDVLDKRERLFVITDTQNARKLIGPGGKTIKKLSSDLGKQIKLLEKSSGSDKEIIEKLIGAPVIAVSKVYSGDESFKVKVDKKYKRMVDPISSVVGGVINKKVFFVFE